MDSEKANYIFTYFSHLLNENEKFAFKHYTSLIKLGEITSENENRLRIYKEKGWISSDENILDLLKDGYEAFEINVAKRILKDDYEKVFFNNCPKCEKLARTPKAKQCRHCGFSWHNSEA